MRLPRHIASGGVRETGLVRATDIGALTNVGDAEFRAIEQVGRAVGKASGLAHRALMSRQAIDDTIESGKATQRVQESWNKVDSTVTNLVPDLDMPLPDDPNYNKTLTTLSKAKIDKMLPDLLGDVEKDAKKVFGSITNPRVKAALINQYNDQYADNVKRIKGSLNAKLNDYQLAEINKLSSAAAQTGNMDVANHYVDVAVKHGLITNVRAVSLKAAYEKVAKKSLIDSTKPIIEQVLIASGFAMDPANEAIDAVVGEMQDNGTLNDVEAAEARQDLSNWAADVAAQRRKSASDAVKKTTHETYTDFSGPITTGNLTYDDIDNSRLLKDDKEKWHTYIKGSYQDPPTENSPDGHFDSLAAVIDAATLQASPTEAMDSLLNARFVDQSITNEQYEWGMDKIANPYPKTVMEDIRSTANDNTENYNDSFSFSAGPINFSRATKAEANRNRMVNELLISWVDMQIADGNTPTSKEMYAQSKKYRWGMSSDLGIGQVIEVGGRSWEVVGFDPSGEPEMETVD